MFIPQIKTLVVTTLLTITMVSVQADVYKWTDDDGQVHFSQLPPEQGQAEQLDIKTQHPANAEAAQAELDALIQSQEESAKAQAEAAAKAAEEAEQAKVRAENCRIAQANLQTYMNNPGRRVSDENGNITYIKEEDRQARIDELNAQIKEFCN
jgi:Skp family chaperone for outer membrane proteins